MEKHLKLDKVILNTEDQLDNLSGYVKKKVMHGETIGKAPFGYKNIGNYDSHNNRKPEEERIYSTVDIEDNDAFIVQEAFRLYATEEFSCNTLSGYLNEKYDYNIPRVSIHKMLTNQFYIGSMLVKGKSYKHIYPTLINQELFFKVQALIKKSDQKKDKKDKKYYLYGSFISCSVCDLSVIGTHSGSRRRANSIPYIYYKCTEYNGKHSARPISQDKLDTFLIKELTKLVDNISTLSLNNSEHISSIISGIKKIYELFKQEPEKRLNIIKVIFNSIKYNSEFLIFEYKRPFDILIDDPEYVSFKINKNDIKSNIFIANIISLINQIEENSSLIIPFTTKKTTEYHEYIEYIKENIDSLNISDQQKNIYRFCIKQQDINTITQHFNISIETLQQDLFDLQLEGLIEETAPGIWKSL